MNPIFIAFIIVDILLFVGVAVSVLLNKKNSADAEYIYLKSSNEVNTCDCACCDCEKEVVEEEKQENKEEVAKQDEESVVEEVKEEVLAEDSVEEVIENNDEETEAEEAEEVNEEVEEDETDDVEENVATTLNIPKDSKPIVPFYTKILNADDKIKLFYNEIRNQFKSYRGINARVSKKADSFRKGRELIAKITYTGKTMKVYLKLNPADYNVNTYHHKDVSDKKSYAEIPLLMRVRSDRSYKYTIALINEMMAKNEVEPKKRYVDVDFIEYLKSFEGLQ